MKRRGLLILSAALVVVAGFHGGAGAAPGRLFDTTFSFDVGDWPFTLATGDFNEDSHADLALTNTGGQWPFAHSHGTVSILLGRGDGSFRAFTSYTLSATSMAGEITTGNFDADEHTDLAVAGPDDTVSILLGRGDGTFQSPASYAAGDAGGIVTGDFDGNEYTDLAVPGPDDAVSILLGNGDGTFQSPVEYPAGGGTGIVTGYFNQDTHTDLALTNDDSDSVSILLGNGNGTFQSAVSYGAGDRPYSIAGGDFSGDGRDDLAVTNVAANTVSVLLGNGNGTFQTAVSYAVGELPAGVSAADFNGDERDDLAVTNSGYPYFDSQTVSILLSNGDGSFQSAVDYTVEEGPAFIVTGDFDEDEDSYTDLAVANHAAKSVSILTGNGDGTFQRSPTYPVGEYPLGIAAADLDKDDDSDIAVANLAGTVSILLGNGDGTFQSAVDYTTGTAVDVTVGKFDEDEHLDLAVSCLSASISILIGNGNGTFKDAVNYDAGSSATGIASANFNDIEDEHADLAVGNYTGGNTVSVLLGTGDGTFESPVSYTVGDTPISITADYFGEDGHADLAVANEDSNTISVLLGTGYGSFQSAVSYALGATPDDLTTGDFNEDGHIDLAVADRDVSILLGKGDGTFQSAVIYDTKGARGIATGDFDDDGHTDLAVSGLFSESGIVSILLGNGDGSFESGGRYTTVGDTPWFMTTGDFDNDGHIDLAVSNQESDDVSILLSALPLDTDRDGMPDEWELTYGLNPNDDSDASGHLDTDGLTNVEEYGNDTDPTDNDTDDDGLNDNDEVNTHSTVPWHPDTDGDGLSDGDEILTYGSDPNLQDTDEDSLSDGDEVNTYGTDPTKEDTDDDSFNDPIELYYGTDPRDQNDPGQPDRTFSLGQTQFVERISDSIIWRPLWSSSGRRITYIAWEAWSPTWCVYVTDLDRDEGDPSRTIEITAPDERSTYWEAVAWSPDGSSVLYGGPGVDIVRKSSAGDGTFFSPIPTPHGNVLGIHTTLLPDGNRMIVCSDNELYVYEITPAAGVISGPTLVFVATPPDEEALSPRLNPDGSKAVFNIRPDQDRSKHDIYVLDLDPILDSTVPVPHGIAEGIASGVIRTIEDRPNFGMLPSFTNDGEMVTWSEDVTGQFVEPTQPSSGGGIIMDFDIMIGSADGGGIPHQLIAAGNQAQIHMSPGGLRVCFTDDPDVLWDLYVGTLVVAQKVEGTHEPVANTVTTDQEQVVEDGSGAEVTIPQDIVVDFPPDVEPEITMQSPIDPVEEPELPPDVDAIPVLREFGPQDTTFSVPVAVTITYTDAQIAGMNEATLRVFAYNELTEVFDIEIPEEDITDRDLENNSITFLVDHFSIFGLGASTDTDGDGIIDSVDDDDDNDGDPDVSDPMPQDGDNDGYGDTVDPDDDSDGIPDGDEPGSGSDTDNDGDPNATDPDDDGDGILDGDEVDMDAAYDTDNDGMRNDEDTDDDSDGYADFDEMANDTDILDPGSVPPDNDGDYVSDLLDPDDDNDALPDDWELDNELDPFDATGDDGADGDPDADGYTNLEEYEGGSDPQDPRSVPVPALSVLCAAILCLVLLGMGCRLAATRRA